MTKWLWWNLQVLKTKSSVISIILSLFLFLTRFTLNQHFGRFLPTFKKNSNEIFTELQEVPLVTVYALQKKRASSLYERRPVQAKRETEHSPVYVH